MRFVVRFAAVLSALVTSAALPLPAAAAPPTEWCNAYDGRTRTHCRTYCDARQCHVAAHPSCDALREKFA